MTEHEVYQATVRHVVRLAVRIEQAEAALAGMAQMAAARAMLPGANCDQAAWAKMEAEIGRLRARIALPPAERTAAGQGGVGGDAPDGSVDDPFGWDANHPIPADAAGRAEQIRWLFEECLRCYEQFNYPRLAAILAWAIREPVGVAHLLERQLRGIETALVGSVGNRATVA